MFKKIMDFMTLLFGITTTFDEDFFLPDDGHYGTNVRFCSLKITVI